MMRTVIRFRAPEHERAEEADDENPQFWGTGLLEELLEKLPASLRVVRTYSPSHGAAAIVDGSGERFTVMLGFRGPDWVLSVNGDGERTPLPDSALSRELVAAIRVNLGSHRDVSDVAWTDWESFEQNRPVWHPTSG